MSGLTFIALAAVLQAVAPSPVEPRPVDSLIGQPVETLNAWLGSGPVEPAITIVENGRRTDIAPLRAFVPQPDGLWCSVLIVRPEFATSYRPDQTPIMAPALVNNGYGRSAQPYVVVSDGRIEAIVSPPIRSFERRPGEPWRSAVTRHATEDQPTPLSSRPGRLPLDEGPAVLSQNPDMAFPGEGVLIHGCQPPPVRIQPEPRQADATGILQGLSLLPFSWMLPLLNAERRAATATGAEAMARLRPGEDVPGGLQRFLADHPEIQKLSDAENPDYSVLVVNMGAPESRNLARRFRLGLVGVRGDKVVWLADDPGTLGLGLTASLCVDAQRRRGPYRPGCDSGGNFVP